MNAADVFALTDREVWIVTARDGERTGGLVATFVNQASIVPELPRVLVGLATQHHTTELVEASGALALHLICTDQLDWVWRFGLASGRGIDKLEGLTWQSGSTGSPILMDALAWLDCRVEARFPTGDRNVYLAAIVEANWQNAAPPLTMKQVLQQAPREKLAAMKELLQRDAEIDAKAIRAWRSGGSIEQP
jgi:flavin reductase (DIM6/NTAB) family NADH-FMN oxidoreductase RutF